MPVEDYSAVHGALADIRTGGARLAADDLGSGYAGFRHLISLKPDIIKLDISLVGGIHRSREQRALASALATFATDIGATVIGEGVEDAEDLDVLRDIGVPWAQGYHLGRPGPYPAEQLIARSGDSQVALVLCCHGCELGHPSGDAGRAPRNCWSQAAPFVAVVVLALIVVIVVLAGRGNSGAKAASVSSAPASPSTSSSPTVSDIYQHVGPSVAVVRTAMGALGTGVIANAAGAVITANHVIADGSAISILFADGTQSTATVASADPTHRHRRAHADDFAAADCARHLRRGRDGGRARRRDRQPARADLQRLRRRHIGLEPHRDDKQRQVQLA